MEADAHLIYPSASRRNSQVPPTGYTRVSSISGGDLSAGFQPVGPRRQPQTERSVVTAKGLRGNIAEAGTRFDGPHGNALEPHPPVLGLSGNAHG